VKETSGGIPQCITFTLGGTDNINVYAKTMGQIFTLLGAKLANNSVDEIELIPLDVLGRPRIDVIASCSGSFRDLHMNQMILIDKAIKMVAEADEAEEMNFVRKHALEQASELDIPLREAATRVFSNAAGAYSSNIAALIKSNDWKSEEQLQKQFIERKGHAFDFDRPDSMEYQGETFKAAMKKCDVTVQNVDLSEIISVTDVPHYYDSDPTKVIQNLREDNKKPLSLWANALKNKDREVLTLAETLRLDALKKIMSPDYYEKVLETPEGVRDISNCLRNVLGWAVTAGDVDTFVFEISYNVFIEDKKMLERLRQNDRDSYQTLITTFLKASEHGYWETAKQNPTNLRRLLVNEWRNSGALTASRHQSSPPPKSHESFSIKSRRSSSSVAVLSKSTSRLSMSTPSKGGIFGSSWRRFRKTPSDQDLSSSSHGELSTVPTWRRGFQPNREDISRSAHGSALSRSIHS
jgi:magnesium chelatase subunit H